MARVSELIWKSNNRSVIRGLEEIAAQSEKTDKQITRNSDRTSASFDRVGTHARRLRDTIGGLLGPIGFAGLAFGIEDAVKAGISLQQQQAQLRAAITQTGTGGAAAYKKLSDAAVFSSEHGGFARDQEVQSLTRFIRTTHSVNKALQANRDAVMLARGAGLDYTQTQKYIQQALVGNVRRLQQYIGPIIQAKDAQYGLTKAHQEEILQLELQSKSMGKNGALWLKQQEILRGITPHMTALAQLSDKNATAGQVLGDIQSLFGNSVSTFNNTTAGRLSNLKNTVEELKASLGEELLPVVTRLAKDGLVVVNLFGRLPAPVQEAVLGFTAIGLLLGPLRNSFGLLRDVMGLFRGSVETTTPEVARLGTASETSAAKEVGGGGLGGGVGGTAAKDAGSVEKKAGRLTRFARGGLGFLKYAGPIGAVVMTGEALNGIITDRVKHPVHSPIFGNKRFADGGTTPYPGTFMVGERGPELVNLPGSAHITPNHQLSQPLVLNVQLRMPSGRLLAEEVIRYSLNRAARGPTSLVGGSLVTGSPGLPA